MAQPPISLLPESLNLSLYGGDGVELRLSVTDSLGMPIELTGTIDAQIRSSRPNSEIITAFNTDITDPANGIVILSLTGTQTESLHGDDASPMERFSGVWDIQWSPAGGEPVTLLQGVVESSLDVTRL